MVRLRVTKCQGTGNDFVLLDRTNGARLDYPQAAKSLCDRRFGVGADGLLVLAPATQADADVAMRIFNADGSEAEMCGNGVRCLARYVFERHPGARRRLAVQTRAGAISTEVMDAPDFAVRVTMGVPEDVFVHGIARIGDITAQIARVRIGTPHAVAFVDVAPHEVDLAAAAAVIESSSADPAGVNVEVARIQSGVIAMRVLERGVGETWACGTGACAVAAAAIAMGSARSPVRIAMRGGNVVVEWAGAGCQAYLTGSAQIVFDADVDVPADADVDVPESSAAATAPSVAPAV